MQNNELRIRKIIRTLSVILLSGRILCMLLYHLGGYVINLPYRSFIIDVFALAGLLLLSLEDVIIKLKIREHKVSKKGIAIFMFALAYHYLFVLPSYYSLDKESEKQSFDFNKYELFLETEYGYDITFGDTWVYLKKRENIFLSKVLVRIRFPSDEHNELFIYSSESDELVVEYYINDKIQTIAINPNQNTLYY
ncbi:MAG: hypothetical protein NC120_08110 [Ruminococcus sp.]|nr:hypothetical protein [Ruminococcus sp.]